MTTYDFPIPTVSEANGRDHWGTKRRRVKKQRQDVALLVRHHNLPCVVTLTRVAPRVLDDDNLRSALKAIRDGIADRLGVSDRDPLVRWDYAQAKGKVREYAVRIEIKEGPWTVHTRDSEA